jgi:hypothetical protein
MSDFCSDRKAITLVAVYRENALRPLVEIPERDEVFIDRKINAGDRGFLAHHETRLIGQPDFVFARRCESGGNHNLPRESFCLGPYSDNGRNNHFKNEFLHL